MKHANSVYRPPGSHIPEKVPAKFTTVKTNTEEKILWLENPFWYGFEMETRKKRTALEVDDPKMMVGIVSGTKEGLAEISKVYEVDSDSFVKVFTRFLHIFFDTSKNAQKLFEVVMASVGEKKENDVVYLHAKDADNYHKTVRGEGYSQASFYRAIDELIKKGIIARSNLPHLFWINPAIFWNGDRLKFITELRKSPEIMPPSSKSLKTTPTLSGEDLR
ncbi:hypothetical protein [Roseinatronobacter sp. S2]|uniref:hypothetical protein n=1 Tax=Roseinatronobacter sp. S2 TaxID=3035471 RepID=UPI0024103CCC|nr:hypothetical protein [Roseinatronobacter sp. S2]WFE75908.1 hypothetical protein P8S53_05785 [Roseinatronobacter sp. S2]